VVSGHSPAMTHRLRPPPQEPVPAPRISSSRANQWQQVRATVLERDRLTCQICGTKPTSGGLDVHHLVPRSVGGPDDPGNLITLCDGCHATRHPNLHASLARTIIERWGTRLARFLDRQGGMQAIDESLGAALRVLRVDHFRTPQLEVVLAAVRGESLLFVSATGSGKSLCFQVPVLLARGLGIVISPLRALMSQQVESLQSRQIPCTFINGDLSPQEKALRYALLRKRAMKFLYCTPERFDPTVVRPAEVAALSQLRPAYLVVDEAHCIDRWGKDFRPNYDRLGIVRQLLGSPPTLAFTATAGVESQRRILASLGIPHARVIVTGVNRPNIALARVPKMTDKERFALIARLLQAMPAGRAMLFVPTVRVGKMLQVGLRDAGCAVPFFHARMGSANERDTLLGQFTGRLSPPARVVICTSAFGMGLDVPDVRLVVHWQHPASVEDYLQEFGRAGRDGSRSVALLFTSREDEGLLRFMAEKTLQSAPSSSPEVLPEKYRAIANMNRMAHDRGNCFRKAIVSYFGEQLTSESRSLAERLVAWLFERKSVRAEAQFCCDHCDRVAPGDAAEWVFRVWTEPKKRPWYFGGPFLANRAAR
jgi:ATP-dependent DNA helicase RecQ